MRVGKSPWSRLAVRLTMRRPSLVGWSLRRTPPPPFTWMSMNRVQGSFAGVDGPRLRSPKVMLSIRPCEILTDPGRAQRTVKKLRGNSERGSSVAICIDPGMRHGLVRRVPDKTSASYDTKALGDPERTSVNFQGTKGTRIWIDGGGTRCRARIETKPAGYSVQRARGLPRRGLASRRPGGPPWRPLKRPPHRPD